MPLWTSNLSLVLLFSNGFYYYVHWRERVPCHRPIRNSVAFPFSCLHLALSFPKSHHITRLLLLLFLFVPGSLPCGFSGAGRLKLSPCKGIEGHGFDVIKVHESFNGDLVTFSASEIRWGGGCILRSDQNRWYSTPNCLRLLEFR